MDQENKVQLKYALFRILGAVILLIAAGIAFRAQEKVNSQYTSTIVPATCTESGYTLYTNEKTGSTEIKNITEPIGHRYDEWITVRESTDIEPAIEEQTCTVCGEKQVQALYGELEIGRLSLNGDFTGIGKTDEVSLTAAFYASDMEFEAYATAKYQGHSTLEFDKKNYTVKFFYDAEHTQKMKMTLSHWNPENKYILKANYQDSSQSRNLVCADIWADIVKSRESLQQELKVLSNYGAVDGFPVALYLNDSFAGLYTMNLHKDDDLFGMKDGFSHGIVIVNHTDGEEAFFNADAAFLDDTPWEIEYCGTEDDAWVKERLNNLINFVQTADDATFRAEIGKYLDLQSAIDYLIAMYSLGLQEHAAKDLILVTYGENAPWICSMYDMEEAFDADGVLPVYKNRKWDSGTGSLLWDRILNLYFDDICERYIQLRSDILNPDALAERLENYVNQIPWQMYAADAEVNQTSAFTGERLENMIADIHLLVEKTDELFAVKGA